VSLTVRLLPGVLLLAALLATVLLAAILLLAADGLLQFVPTLLDLVGVLATGLLVGELACLVDTLSDLLGVALRHVHCLVLQVVETHDYLLVSNNGVPGLRTRVSWR
jgi:hypothetical protein